MAKVNLSTIKNWFKTGLKPTQAQFWDTWDSFWHKDELIPADKIENLTEILLEKADAEALANHTIAADAHSALFDAKVDKVAGKELSDNNLTDEMVAKINASNPLSGSRLIRGNFAILPNRIIRLFIYEYVIADEYFDTPILTDVQLDVGGAEDRADTVAINNQSQAVVKKGIEGNPSPPDIDIATELFITWRLMKAGATEPDGVTATAIYNENLGEAGGEWNAAVYSAGSINVDGASNPSSGLKSVTVSNSVKYESLFLSNSVAKKIDPDGTLQFKLFLENAWAASDKIWIVLYNGDTRITSNFPTIQSGVYGFDGTLINEHQVVSVPFKDFSLLDIEFTRIQWFFFPKGKNYSIDEVQLFDATGQPDTGGETAQVISRTSQIPVNDGLTGNDPYATESQLPTPFTKQQAWEGELQAPAYPNSRNDGQIPHNKVLSTDENGNVKLYSIATAPAPYLEELIPDSHLPSTTGNFILKGSFFIPEMCDIVNNPNAIIVQGQTINYATFISDNEIHCNITTGAIEGLFDVTLNNGLEVTFSEILFIIEGDVSKPKEVDYTIISGNPDLSKDGEIISTLGDVAFQVNLDSPTFQIPTNVNFSLYFSRAKSPLNIAPDIIGENEKFYLRSLADNTQELYLIFNYRGSDGYNYLGIRDRDNVYFNYSSSPTYASVDTYCKKIIKISRIDDVFTISVDGNTPKVINTIPLGAIYADFRPKEFDFDNIRLVIHP